VLSAQTAADLCPDRRVVRGKRQQSDQPTVGDQPIAEALRLRLLAALIQAFEGDE
jgi:hypothetical protein